MDFSKITVAVIGLGLMGGSFAMRLKELGAAVIGINRTLSMAEAALRQGIVDSIDISDLKHADIVIFCTPAKATLAFVKDHLPDFRSNAIMTDIAGVKGNLADDIRQILPLGMDFISSHPMCGHEGEGLSRADPDIFRGANYILLPDKTNRPESVELLRNMALALGCRHVPSITPEEHDRHIAAASKPPAEQPVFGVYTETRPSFRPGVTFRVSLLQLSTPTVCYLFRLNKIPLAKPILQVLETDSILKIGADVAGDLRSLRQIRHFRDGGFVDLQSIAPEWGIEDKSLRKLSAIVLRQRVSKAQRLSNWEAATLTDKQKLYAATAAWVCTAIYDKLLHTPKINRPNA